jgi:hypothetical protein
MRTLILTLATAAALIAAPALAQTPSTSAAGAAPPAKTMDMASMTPAQMHEHCQAMMGQKMKGRTPHDHSVEKLGHAPPPPTPPSEAEMKRMHDKCAAMMAEKTEPKPK